jgi:hypothetical protein
LGYQKNIPERKRKPKGGCHSEGEMTMGPVINQTAPTTSSKSGSLRAALALVVLAPLVGEVLSGATRISFIFVFVPEMMVWGCGTLIIRELVRRWNGGWNSILLLGLGLSIAEEFVIQQTSLAPLPWPSIGANYGRLGGVNWIFFLFMLGYECVWITVLPIQLAELIFAERRNEGWLGNRGLIISAVIFVLGSLIAWAAWIKRARPIVFHAPDYTPPSATILAGLLAIALLAFAAYKASRIRRTPVASHMPPSPWVVTPAAMVMCPPVVPADLPDLRLEITVALLDSDHHGPPLGGARVSGHSILDIVTPMAGYPSMGARLRCHTGLHDCRLFRQQPLATDRPDRQSHPQCARRRRSSSPRSKDQTASSLSIRRART